MNNKKKKTVISLILAYLVLTTGIWTFLLAYCNSYNSFTTEKIKPANIVINGNTASTEITGRSFSIDIGAFMPESRLYYFIYFLAPDEIRFWGSIGFFGQTID